MKINNTIITSLLGDITKADYVDAIVNPTNSSMIGNSGLNKAIHLAAGDNLRKACEKLGQCEIGEAKATDAYNLPCNYIIHTVGPVWQDGKHLEKEQLRSCYQKVLDIAKSLQVKTIGFSSISTGARGFPKDKAAEIAIDVVTKYVIENPKAFDKIIWIVQSEETKETYDSAIAAREILEDINASVQKASIPIRAINWHDILFYGSSIESVFNDENNKIVQGVVRCIDSSGKLKIIILPGVCIENGNWIYARQSAIETLQKKEVLLCRTILHDSTSVTSLSKELHADYTAYMRQHGYFNLLKTFSTDIQRKKILGMLIRYNQIPPEQIIIILKKMCLTNHSVGGHVVPQAQNDIAYIYKLMNMNK